MNKNARNRQIMEKRRSKRITVSLKAERISGDSNHSVFIENLSEHGICMTAAPAKTAKDFTPETIVRLKLQLSSDEILNLNCKVIWSHNTLPHGLTKSVGLEIIDPPPKYTEFVKTLR